MRRFFGAALIAALVATLLTGCRRPVPPDGVDSRFGIAVGCCMPDMVRELDAYRDLGVRWARLDLAWPTVQADGPDSWNWTEYDRFVTLANERAIHVLPILTYSPAWASSTGLPNGAPRDDADFARFAAAAVRRYSPRGVRHWEIWNEPNFANFWSGLHAGRYVGMLNRAYDAIKAVDPNAFVISGGLAPAQDADGNIDPRRFVREMYAGGAKFDALGFHPYVPSTGIREPAEWSNWNRMLEVRQYMVDQGDAGKKIWMTEYGIATQGGGDIATEARQAEMVTEVYDEVHRLDWAGPLFWYQYREWGGDPQNREHHFGITRFDDAWTPKPAVAAYRAAVAEHDG